MRQQEQWDNRIFTILNETQGRGIHTTKVGLYSPHFGIETLFGHSLGASLEWKFSFSKPFVKFNKDVQSYQPSLQHYLKEKFC